MSLQALTWALTASEAAGNDRLVIIVQAHYASEDGFSFVSKPRLAAETRLSEPTIYRCQASLINLGELERAEPTRPPADYLAIPANRRPTLYQMTAFLGSHFATPSPGAGASQGHRRGISAVHATPSDQERRDAIVNRRTKNVGASPSETEKEPDPECVRCQGRGVLYSATAGVDFVCPCADTRPHVVDMTR